MKKNIKCVALFLVMTILCSTMSFAAYDPQIELQAESDAFIQISHTSDFDSDTGLFLYGANVIAKSGATSTYVSCVIQRKESGGYVNVPGSWISQSQQGRYASVGSRQYVYKGYWYRTQATYIVHINGQEYKVVDNSDQYWYN